MSVYVNFLASIDIFPPQWQKTKTNNKMKWRKCSFFSPVKIVRFSPQTMWTEQLLSAHKILYIWNKRMRWPTVNNNPNEISWKAAKRSKKFCFFCFFLLRALVLYSCWASKRHLFWYAINKSQFYPHTIKTSILGSDLSFLVFFSFFFRYAQNSIKDILRGKNVI